MLDLPGRASVLAISEADVIAFESAWRTLVEQSQKFLLVIEEQRRN